MTSRMILKLSTQFNNSSALEKCLENPPVFTNRPVFCNLENQEGLEQKPLLCSTEKTVSWSKTCSVQENTNGTRCHPTKRRHY